MYILLIDIFQGSQNINLLQQKMLIPPDGVQIPKPVIPNDNRDVNCNPEYVNYLSLNSDFINQIGCFWS